MVERPDNGNEDLDTLGERLTPEHMSRVDAKYFTPKERSQRVLDILEQEELTRWDYLCFSVEFLGQFGIAYFEFDKVFSQLTKLLGKWLYNLHYFNAEQVYGPPEEGKKK